MFYFFPTFADPVRTLVDFANLEHKENRHGWRLLYSRNDFNQDALSGLRAQAKIYSMEIVSEQEYEVGKRKAPRGSRTVKQKKPADVFFFDAAPDFKAVTDEIYRAKLNMNVFSTVVMIGRGAFALRPHLSAQTFLSYPSSFPNESELTEFLALTRKAHIELRNPAFIRWLSRR